MRILGIDPGYGIVGYGVVEKTGNRIVHVAHGAITTGKEEHFEDRLDYIYSEISKIISTYNPSLVAIESLYFYKNAKTAIYVGEARGVILLAIKHSGIPFVEFTPHQVKQTVTGYGRAEKSQIQKVMKMLLKLYEVPKPDDAADALAVAWCAAVTSSGSGQLGLLNQFNQK
ncbi:MAG: crossover junction endodeoxyribonuclease RuvC [Fervidobacterium pennivorans]|uniref:Crossover junction endodeoxyribonuclease RuvC n=1 Tax=Fervidobacterium pennivorans TaxID=93466 RepID=A0A172T400_FERPE|nr:MULTISPECIES: crossover junction endodeoxyribonuclease RuvC [Fervidobacterium]ANE41701.1 Holliday junction resolvase [Fervidobacterium pennivorans]MDM7320122.1 crossover junction endodeoxyribonuclease RuvC [Fervidobacterium sp.]NPU89755.1 crossover junction endodeoxyribonuclease RuvC [Fervidobacterium sp.]